MRLQFLQPKDGRSANRPAIRSFGLLVAVAVLATGALTSSLGAKPSPLTGIRVLTSGLILIISLALTARVMVAIERARRQAGGRTSDDV